MNHSVLALAVVFFCGCEAAWKPVSVVPTEPDETEGVDAGDFTVAVDAGVEVDAGVAAVDAGAELDAGVEVDAGVQVVDAGAAVLTMSFSPGQLVPAFDPAITEYELSEYSALAPTVVTVSGASDARVGTLVLGDGQPAALTPGPLDGNPAPIVVTVGTTEYRVRLRPADWPSFTVTSRDPSPGVVLLTPFEWYTTRYGHFVVALDAQGQVLFYRRVSSIALDFQRHVLPGGAVRYSYWSAGVVQVLDEHFAPLRTFQVLPTAARTSVTADAHDFILLSDDHCVLVAYYDEYATNVPASLSPAVGGAFVTAALIQEVDAGQVVFEWDSTEHPELYALSTDGNAFGNASAAADYAHLNSVVIDPNDENFVASFRHLDAVLKLDRHTGEIVWRLGGEGDSFGTPPAQRTSHQHFTSVIGPDTLQVFDNGNAVGRSRVVTYQLDPDAGVVQSFSELDLGWFAFAMGSAQLRGDTLFVGLGANGPGTPDALEFALDGGAETFRLQFDDDVVYSYRALKY